MPWSIIQGANLKFRVHLEIFKCSLLGVLCRILVHLWTPAILVFFINDIELYLLHLWPPAILDPAHLGLLSFLHLPRQVHQGRPNIPQHTLPPGDSPPLSGHHTVEGIPHLPGKYGSHSGTSPIHVTFNLILKLSIQFYIFGWMLTNQFTGGQFSVILNDWKCHARS